MAMYRDGVGIMLFHATTGKVFVGKRLDTKADAWQMPQGGVDAGEAPLDAMYRELAEETGLNRDAVHLLGQSPEALRYDLPPELVPHFWQGRYKGQSQWWYALRLDADEGAINIRTQEPEFSEWKWADMQDLPGMIVPFKRALYVQVLHVLAPFQPRV